MIARLKDTLPITAPAANPDELRTESDVEQKVIYPYLAHPSYIGLPSTWIRTKEYMQPTELDKGSGKRVGYYPDYSVWLNGFPLVVIEAKDPTVEIGVGLREARLYAAEINKRYPPKVNPIQFVVASNGVQIALSQWDSETEALIADIVEAQPGSSVLEAMRKAVGRTSLEALARLVEQHFRGRPFHRTSSLMGGQSKLGEQLGVNQFADHLLPLITRYFGNEAEEARDEIIRRAYVSSEEVGTYGSVLETYLRDRTRAVGGSPVEPLVTSRSTATRLSTELQKFGNKPTYHGRVQLVVGAVGAGKSTFIERYFKLMLPESIREKTLWAFIDFNSLAPGQDSIQNWVAEQFLSSFAITNIVDLDDLEVMEKILTTDIRRFEKGPAKLLEKVDSVEYARQRAALIQGIISTPVKYAEAVSRHFSGERGKGLVIVFDNVDKRSRDLQLDIFEAAQWLRNLTRSLVIVNLRDTTFEAHREEPPLDAFINAVNFYIRPPRFAQVIRKRLELVTENLPNEVEKRHIYSLEGGQKISYPASKLGSFIIEIYSSLFQQGSRQLAAAMEALVAKDVRRALGMFTDILLSPHVPAGQITSAALGNEDAIQEARLLRSLMRGRYKLFNGRMPYIKNILTANVEHNRPSNLIIPDILEYLVRNRKSKIDFSTEGYAITTTVINQMAQLGYDEQDTLSSLRELVKTGLIEPESLVLEELRPDDPIRVHASGFIHMKFLLTRYEYVVGITPDTSFASYEVADDIARTWNSQAHLNDLTYVSKKRVAERMAAYFRGEYDRRCRRHPFYEDLGFGGKYVTAVLARVAEGMLLGAPLRHGRGNASR